MHLRVAEKTPSPLQSVSAEDRARGVAPIGDHRTGFILALLGSWAILVALPIAFSVRVNETLSGLPVFGILLWFALMRIARWLSPPARVDRMMGRGHYSRAVRWCDRALAITGPRAWAGTRRLLWLNRRVNALLGLGRPDDALPSALEAIRISADPETLANCAAVLLWLNWYDDAARAARHALVLSRERSISANATLARVMLARGLPAEAEAFARAGLGDVDMLFPTVRPEHHVACLTALAGAQRALGEKEQVRDTLKAMKRAAGRRPLLRAMVLVEGAEALAAPGASDSQLARARKSFIAAVRRFPAYVVWLASQPAALPQLAIQPWFAGQLKSAREGLDGHETMRMAIVTPQIAEALKNAQETGNARPSAQSSKAALAAQLFTLSGTVVLLFWWTWHFFIVGA